MIQFSPTTLGKQLKRIEAGGFILTEAYNSPFVRWPPHAHELASITFVLKGLCLETIGTSLKEMDLHSAVIKPPGAVHSNRYGNLGARVLIIEVGPKRLASLRLLSHSLDHVAHLRGGALPSFAVRLYRELNIGDNASALAIEGLVLEVIGEVTRLRAESSSVGPPRWLNKAKKACDEQRLL
ncbi:MAG: hypothetical protein ACREBG_25190 [Pyrinomonadaceae bacterium]